MTDELVIGRGTTPVCAIGASAGGVAALRAFFSGIPDDLGLAYVVIVHLAPDHPSLMAEILAGVTKMPVEQVTDGPPLRPNAVYVIPPDAELVIEGDDVKARPFSKPRSQRAPIDMFFRSVAAGRGDGLAVLLTGAGSDGAEGVRAIKEAGGVIFVQDPEEAEFPPMPRSAIATGAADFVGPIAHIVERIVEVVRSKLALREIQPGETADEITRIVSFLRVRTGHDFARYKRATVQRRIGRRMQVARLIHLSDYADYVRDNPEEAHNLFRDLLISVTMFFRDAAAYEALEREAIAPMFDNLQKGAEIRVWAVGCATGEEAYSIAILLLEAAAERGIRPPIQVFATDLDEGAIATAREGRYPASIEADMSDERLQRFFVRDGSHYRVRPELRSVVLFATHSVVKDPPFTRLDLVTCRNLLIYLERDLQRHACTLFHYGLKPNGYLFLGSAETCDSAAELFATVSRQWRIYLSMNGSARPPLPHQSVRRDVPPPPPPLARSAGDNKRRRDAAIHGSALEANAPPSVTVDSDLRVLHLSPSAGRFFLPSGGAMALELPALVRPELRLELQRALHRAFGQRLATLTFPVAVAFEGARQRVASQVAPVLDDTGAVTQAIVFFLEGTPIAADEVPAVNDEGEGRLSRLTEDLRVSQDRLAESRGDHDIAIQELRAANEEMQSINEEYRSTSEELETSKEELQSMNEELQTVNAELKVKLESISTAHSDLQNLVAATEIGTLFLDEKMRIRMFTARVTALFNITVADIGRTITDFTHHFRVDGIEDEARRVIDTLEPSEREVESNDRRWFIMRLRPYKTIENRINGVVATFVDVSERRHAAEMIRQSEARYRSLFDSMGEGLLVAEPIFNGRGEAVDIAYSDANPAAAQIVTADFTGRRLTEVSRDFEPHWWEIPARVLATGISERHELYASPFCQWFDTFIWKPEPTGRQVAILFRDTTERRRADEELRETRDLLTLATTASRVGWGTWDFRTGDARWDERGQEILGLSPDETRAEDWLARLHLEDRDGVEAHLATCVAERRPFEFDARVLHPDGAVRYVHAAGVFVADDAGTPVRGTGLVRDVTEQHQWSESQQLLVGELNHRVKNMLAVVQAVARQTQKVAGSAGDFVDAFEQRLRALASAHSLLTRGNWQNVQLAELAREILGTFGAGRGARVETGGPPVDVDANAAVFLTMALNELATNATKYGALSGEAGRITLTWGLEDGDERLRIAWRETGGPRVEPPQRRGFGRSMLEGGATYELDAEVNLDFAATGVVYMIAVPLGPKLRLAS